MSKQTIYFADLYENWPYYVYNISSRNDPNQFNELGQLQDFSIEQETNQQGKINAAQRMRYVMLGGTLMCYVTYFLYMDLDGFFIPFTNWTLMLTTVSLWASIQASNDVTNFGKDSLQTSDKAVFLQARHHLLYTMTIVCNFIVTSFYWFMMREEQQNIHGKHEDYGWGRSVHLELVHSIPGAAAFVNAIVTNCILKKDNWKFITYMTIVYGLFCWAYFLTTGVVQYSFLDFGTGEAFKNLFWINLASVIVYIVFCIFDERIKPINDASSIYSYGQLDKRNHV